MANTRTLMNPGADHDSDPHDDLGHIPRGGDVPIKPYKAKTGKAGSLQAARIDEDERVAAIKRASLAGLGSTPEDERLAARDRVREIREKVLGLQNGVGAVAADDVQIEPVQQGPEYPPVEPGDQARIF